MDMDEARELLAGPVGAALIGTARGYVAPLCWGTPKEDGEWTVDHNGSAFVLDTGTRRMLVTAAHVFEGYLQAQAHSAQISCQVGNVAFPVTERLIENGSPRGVDIATFQIEDNEIARLGKSILVGSNHGWPPAEAPIGNGVVFAGFPGLERLSLRNRNVNFGIYSAITPVTHRSDRHFICQLDRTEWHDTIGCGLPPEGYDLGGASGAPVLVLEETPNHVITWRLGGVLYNAAANLAEVLCIAHARFINDDGTLDIPPEQEVVLPLL